MKTGNFVSPVIWSAALLLSGIGPLLGDEVAYLMYSPGTQGKTAPIRVLWDELDKANARITIDVGEQYEPWLKNLGLGRVLKYDAKLNNRYFVVRDGALTSFVGTVATSIIAGLQLANPTASGDVSSPHAEVRGAMLFITPAPGRVHRELEVMARLHVTYQVAQPSGPPRLQELINNDLLFVGEPEPLDPVQAARLIEKAFGAYIPESRKRSVNPVTQVRHVDEATFAAVLRRLRLSPVPKPVTAVDRTQNPAVIYIRPGAPPYTSAHEVTYLYQSEKFRSLGRGLSRGMTHVLAEQGTADGTTGKSRFDFGTSYGKESMAARALLDRYGGSLVLPAFFGEDPAAIKALHDAVDRGRGPGTFEKFLALLRHGDGTPAQIRIEEAVALITR